MLDRTRLLWLLLLGLVMGLWTTAGCRGCQETPPPSAGAPVAVADAGGPVSAPESAQAELVPGPAQALVPPGDESPFGKRYESPAQGARPVELGKPVSFMPLPEVSDEEIENDPALNGNPNLPPGSKRTLKVLQKLSQTDPRFARTPSDGPKPEMPSDDVKKGPVKAP